MQISAASLRMHAACVALPLKAPVSAWSATRRLAANKSSRTFLHTVQAAEQRAAGEDPRVGQTKTNRQRAHTCVRTKYPVTLRLRLSLRLSYVAYVIVFAHCSCNTQDETLSVYAALQQPLHPSRRVKALQNSQLTIHQKLTQAAEIQRPRALSSRQKRAILVQMVCFDRVSLLHCVQHH